VKLNDAMGGRFSLWALHDRSPAGSVNAQNRTQKHSGPGAMCILSGKGFTGTPSSRMRKESGKIQNSSQRGIK